MPYIPKSQKQKADDGIIKDCDNDYSIHQLIDRYMEINKESYQTYNDIIGALGVQNGDLQKACLQI